MISESVRLERERRKTYRQAAQIEMQRELMRSCTQVLCDPLWSSVLGFAAVHALRKADMIGPVADDILYAGVIAINTARSGVAREAREGAVGMLDAAGRMIGGARDMAGSVAGLLAKPG